VIVAAVLDVSKTNDKLSAVDAAGTMPQAPAGRTLIPSATE